jgi:hypothetical protein
VRCYIARGPYTYSGEPTVLLETSPGKPGLVFLRPISDPLARAAGRIALVVQAPNAPAVLDAKRPGDQPRQRRLVLAPELLIQAGLVLNL